MHRSVITLLLGYLLCTTLWAQPAAENKEAEFVLILSSYSFEKEWSTALAKEIRSKLEHQKPSLKVNTTYAAITGATSFLADRFSMQGAFANGRLNMKITMPDVLVLVGDESWMLYRVMNLRGRWEGVPVVLCGIHAEIPNDYQKFFPNKQLPDSSFISLPASASKLKVTAVIEPDNSQQTVQLAQTLMPGLKILHYLSDGSYGDTYMETKLRNSASRQGISLRTIRINPNTTSSTIHLLDTLPVQGMLVTNGAPVPDNVHIPVLTLRDMTYGAHTPIGGYFAPISTFAEKTTQSVLRILEGDSVGDIPFVTASDASFYLNRTALMQHPLEEAASSMPDAIDRNVPPPFIYRHLRVIACVLLVIIVLVYAFIRIINSRRYYQKLNTLYERHKTLYDEYQVVYENMPVGLMLFDIYGNLLNRNVETDLFFEQYAHSKSGIFHLYQSGILSNDMHQALLRKELVNCMVYLQQYCYRVQCCLIADEESGDNRVLAIVIDNTEIEKERKAKEQIYSVLNFAMNKATIGVAQYNLTTKQGFATDAWYDTLGVGHAGNDLSVMHHYLAPTDRGIIQKYMNNVSNGWMQPFLGNLQIGDRGTESHHIRCLIQPLEDASNNGEIVVVSMMLNIDHQIARQNALEVAMRKAQEADNFKNSFVANMQDDIKIPLCELLCCAQQLVVCTDQKQKEQLNARIEAANARMLHLLHNIIEVTQEHLNE